MAAVWTWKLDDDDELNTIAELVLGTGRGTGAGAGTGAAAGPAAASGSRSTGHVDLTTPTRSKAFSKAKKRRFLDDDDDEDEDDDDASLIITDRPSSPVRVTQTMNSWSAAKPAASHFGSKGPVLFTSPKKEVAVPMPWLQTVKPPKRPSFVDLTQPLPGSASGSGDLMFMGMRKDRPGLSFGIDDDQDDYDDHDDYDDFGCFDYCDDWAGIMSNASSDMSAGGDGLPRYPQPARAIRRPLDSAQSQAELRKLLENVQHAEDVTPIDKRIKTPEQLTISLLEHQKLGVEWMLKMEKGSNHGGILADDMGLGKTIQSIATIVSNRPPTDRHGPTLIVAPVSLVNQWEQEIRDKTKPDTLKIYSYYGAKRTKDAKLLKEFDIIITSYPLLGNDWPTDKKGKGKAAAPKIKTRGEESDEEVLDVSKRSAAGPLFKIKFHRVILDEAHFIKNKNTRAALAACQLETTHRWCLTGTPIQNSLDELYSLIKFLQIKPYCEWTNFQTKISKPFKKGRHQQVLQRVQYVLKAICLRRTKTSLLDGKAIITLPKREVIIDAVQMSQAEREFYDALEKRQKLRFNAYLRAGTVQKNYTNILTLLLRLRQACLHPSLLKDQDKAPEPEDDESIQRLQRQLESLKVDVKTRLLNSGSEEGDCPICFDAPQAAVFVPNCGHVYCNECIVSYINNESAAVKVCPTCRGPIAENALISLASFMKKYRPEEEAAADAKGKAPATEEELLQDLVTADTPATWLSSTKIERTMVLLEQTRLKHPGEKTIIFSNFTGMLDLLEVPLQQAGFKYTRYDGSMDLKARTAATEQLHNDPETCVMLTSIKCGSLGLNLTCANRVIMLDFWWNPAVENQAIDRVHRFGQTKDVVVHRITVQRTVEDRILEMQAKKQDMADQALGEGDGDGRSLAKGRLGLNDLIHLFGADL